MPYSASYCLNEKAADWHADCTMLENPDFVTTFGENFKTPAEAEDSLVRLRSYHPHLTWRVQELLDKNWKRREQYRFDDGTYVNVPWADEPWAAKHRDHYVHLSIKTPGAVSFTESEAKGLRDRQSQGMRAGRYLTQFHSEDLTPSEIEMWAGRVQTTAEGFGLRYTQDADEIVRAYTGNGHGSCMSHDERDYSSDVHPTRVYAGPDLAVAYMGDLDSVTARCVIWPEKKIWNRIYGNHAQMTAVLEGAGYSKGLLEGARVQLLRNGCGRIIMPYVDYIRYAHEKDGFAVLGSGHIECQRTDGVGEEPEAEYEYSCDRCDDGCDETHSVITADPDCGDSWCYNCYEEYAFACEITNENYQSSRWTMVRYRPYVGATYVNVACLEQCDEELTQPQDSDDYHLRDNCFVCEDCEEWFLEASRHTDHDDCCDSCGDERDPVPEQHDAHVILYHTVVEQPRVPEIVDTPVSCEFGVQGYDASSPERVWFEVQLWAGGMRGTYEQAAETVTQLRRQYPHVRYEIRTHGRLMRLSDLTFSVVSPTTPVLNLALAS